jgi:Flp pilus assembly protein TadD
LGGVPSEPSPATLPPQALSALEADDVRGLLDAVDALHSQGDDEGAHRALVAAHRRWPREEPVALRLLDALRRAGDDSAVRALARSVAVVRLRSSDLAFALGTWAEERGLEASAALSFARAARLAADDPEPVVRLSRVFRRAGRPDLAERAVKRALVRLPDASALHGAMGYALVDAMRPVGAAGAFREAVRLEPDWPVYREDLAYALVLAERWREAVEAAHAAVKAAPRGERGWTALATACSRLGQREPADWAFRNALEVARDPSRTQGNYGLFLSSDPARLLEAGRHLKAALEAHPDWDEVRDALAGLSQRR